MQNNVVIAVFADENQARKAYIDLMAAPSCENKWFVPEAALIKCGEDDVIEELDGFGYTPDPISGKAAGIVIGGLVGLLTGNILGVVLGTVVGAGAGRRHDDRVAVAGAVGTTNVVAVVASKIYAGEIAIAAAVSEEEPAFDEFFEGYDVVINRYDAADIAEEVDALYDLEAEIAAQIYEDEKAERKAERKAAREARREEFHAKVEKQFDEYAESLNRVYGFDE